MLLRIACICAYLLLIQLLPEWSGLRNVFYAVAVACLFIPEYILLASVVPFLIGMFIVRAVIYTAKCRLKAASTSPAAGVSSTTVPSAAPRPYMRRPRSSVVIEEIFD